MSLARGLALLVASLGVSMCLASPAVAATTGISGTVTGTSANPLGSICVSVFDQETDIEVSDPDFRTDPSGNYATGELEPGVYYVVFVDCGGHNVLSNDQNDVSVTAGNVTTVNAVLNTAGNITGTVTDASDDPLSDICLEVFKSDPFIGWYLVRNGLGTDSNGNYDVWGLAGGSYAIKFFDCGSHGAITEYYEDKPDLFSATPITVIAGSVTSGIDAVLATGGTISGTVTDASANPLQDVCVDLYDSNGDLYSSDSCTGFDGKYAIGGLPSGDYKVYFFDRSGKYLLDLWFDAKLNKASATPVAVVAGSETPGVNAVMTRSGSITGTVTDARGAPLDVCINAYDSNDEYARTSRTGGPGGDGKYYLTGLRTGSYKLQFYDCGEDNVREYYDDTMDYALATPVAVVAGSETPGIDAVLATSEAPPETTIDTGPSGTIKTNRATFTFQGTAGDTAKLLCKLDGEEFSDCTSPKSYTGLSDGSHTFSVKAEDNAGNQDQTPATRAFTVDTTVYKAKISKVKVSGPGKVKKGKKAAYRVKVTNSGNIEATGVRLKVSGKGVSFNTSVGKIAAGKTKTVKVKLKAKKPGKVKVSFKVTSKNAGGKTVKEKITVRK